MDKRELLKHSGASWPMNVMKSIKTKSTKGKSLAFLILIFACYICGTISKLAALSFQSYVMFFYVLNLLMVETDIILYAINYSRERHSCPAEK